MISRPNLRFTSLRYHRNGVSGEGFYAVRFTQRDGRTRRQLQAVVFDAAGCCAVTSADPSERFRGDWYEPAIRAYIESDTAQAAAFG